MNHPSIMIQGNRRQEMALPWWRPWLVVIGGFLVHLTLGTVYTFGNMSPYMTSYIRLKSNPPDLDYSQMVWNFALSLAGQGGSMFIGGYIEKRIGPRWSTLIGAWIMSAGVLMTSFAIKTSFYMVILTYGAIFGFGVGIAYAPPMACAMKWLPNHKGLVNGIVVAGFGGGAFIFDQVQTKFINPENLQTNETSHGQKYFNQEELLDRVPHVFLVLGICYATMQFIGCMLLSNPPIDPETRMLVDNDSEDSNSSVNSAEIFKSPGALKSMEVSDMEPREVITSKNFYILWLTFLVNGQAVVFISTLYKAYGQTFIDNDRFLAAVGAVAAVFNSLGRVAWGHLCDRASYKLSMLVLTSLMAIWMLTFTVSGYLGHNGNEGSAKALFFIWVCLIFGTFSGSFALLPTATARCFGQKYIAINYGLVFTSQVITGVLGALLASNLQSVIGWFGIFSMAAGFSFIGFLLTCAFDAKRPDGRDV